MPLKDMKRKREVICDFMEVLRSGCRRRATRYFLLPHTATYTAEVYGEKKVCKFCKVHSNAYKFEEISKDEALTYDVVES